MYFVMVIHDIRFLFAAHMIITVEVLYTLVNHSINHINLYHHSNQCLFCYWLMNLTLHIWFRNFVRFILVFYYTFICLLYRECDESEKKNNVSHIENSVRDSSFDWPLTVASFPSHFISFPSFSFRIWKLYPNCSWLYIKSKRL